MPSARTLTTSAVAKMLGVSTQAVINWVNNGQLPSDRTPGGHRRIDPVKLRQFLESRNSAVPESLTRDSSAILIVDDEPTVGKLLSKSIQTQFPHRKVLVAKNGFEAGEIIAEHRPAVVVLDLFMPGLDGFEVCRRIKANPRTSDTLVIAITAFSSPQNVQRAKSAGAVAVLSKPVTARQLIPLLLRHFSKAM